MRHLFFLVLAGTLTVVILGWAVYMFGQALWQVFEDWRLGRELDELEAESESRRHKREHARTERLANGCQHDFETGSVGFPPNVCPKCGLEKERPTGNCDHVWRIKSGAVPGSECERCGKTYSPIQPARDLNRK